MDTIAALRSAASTETITLVRARHRRLAKLVTAGGEIVGYDLARGFDMAEVAVTGLDDLAALLRQLEGRSDSAILRGKPIAGARVEGVRRLLYPDAETGDAPTLQDVPRRWLALDLDGLDRPETIPPTDLAACAAMAACRLPAPFHGVRCIAQATASHGLKPGIRLRLWFWLSRPASGDELKCWLRDAPTDRAIFSAAQLIYTAAPIFEGRPDHLPTRLVQLAGAESVQVPPAEALTPPPPPEPPPFPIGADLKSHATAQAARMIARALYRVATAPDGQKHHTLRAAATTIGGLLDVARISENEAQHHLVDAVMRAGAIDRRNAERTAAWGLAKGRERPLVLGGAR